MGSPSIQSNASLSQSLYSQGPGTTASDPFITVFSQVDPTPNDANYPVKKRWINLPAAREWVLMSFTNITSSTNLAGETKANWLLINNAAPTLLTLTGNTGGPVGPSMGNINVVGDGTTITITGNPGTNTLTASLIGGSTAIEDLLPDTGTSPVSGNIITVTNTSILATGTLSNALRSNGLSGSSIAYQTQFAGSNATVSTPNNFGVSQFDSNQFTVTSGFVQLAGGTTAAIEKVNVQTGTSPIVPTASAITINGALVAAGTNPVRTDGTGVSTMAVEVQTSQALAAADSTKVGLSNFNSSQFTVTATGFVSTNGNTVNWVQISASQTLVKNTGYFCISPGGALALALPTTASSTIGDLIEVTLDGATSWTITQAAAQQIRYGTLQTTAGTGGSLAGLQQGATIRMVYQATGKWNVLSSLTNLTVT